MDDQVGAMRQKSLRFSHTSFFHMTFLYDKDEFILFCFTFLILTSAWNDLQFLEL